MTEFNKHRFLRFQFSVFSLVLVSIEKICHTRKIVFHHIPVKILRSYFQLSYLFWKCGQTRSFVFDIKHITSILRRLITFQKRVIQVISKSILMHIPILFLWS